MFQIDHLILGCSNLESGVEDFAARTGSQPAFGGEHPTLGTHNALASLGDGLYLEVIAPRPRAQVQGRWRLLLGHDRLYPIGWAVRVGDMNVARRLLQSGGFQTADPQSGSRLRPDGGKLRWTTADVVDPEVALAPFLIEWTKTTTHPSVDAPGGCALESLELGQPNPQVLARLLEAMGLGLEVRTTTDPRMIVTLRCPTGRVVFDSSLP
jgi:hypothetical protein